MRGAAYVIGLLIITIPLVETAFAVLPIRLHEPPWRLGAVNGFAGAVGLPLVGLFLCFAVALLTGDRLVLWLVSGFCAFSGVLFLFGAGSFVLDALQMQGQVRAGLATKYSIASSWAVFKISFCAIAFLMLAARSVGATRAMTRGAARAAANQRSVLVPRSASSMPSAPAPEASSLADPERPVGTR